jgi:hypothetical protein
MLAMFSRPSKSRIVVQYDLDLTKKFHSLVPDSIGSKKNWPLKYFCNMHSSFIATLTGDTQTLPLKFEAAFGHSFVKVTYYDNVAKWWSLSGEEQKQAVALDRTPQGEWSHIFKNYQKGKPP